MILSLPALASAARESLELLSCHSVITTANGISQTEVATSVPLHRPSLEPPLLPTFLWIDQRRIVASPWKRRAVSGERCWD